MRFLLLPLLFAFTFPDLPEPYRNVELLPADHHGWYQNAAQMEETIYHNSIKTVVEVGSWLGNSTLHIAKILPEGGKVYAVDHWKGSVEHQPGESAWYQALPYLYEQFLSNVIHAGMTHKVIPTRMSSLEAAAHFKNQNLAIDFVYLDGAHDTESVYKDLTAWYPYVKGHGVIAGDDWSWESVRRAVLQFAQENELSCVPSGNFWRLYE